MRGDENIVIKAEKGIGLRAVEIIFLLFSEFVENKTGVFLLIERGIFCNNNCVL
jgi:hypothetical protein